MDALQDTFPGRFTTVSPAAVELHATMSLFHDQAIHVHLAPDADGERQFLPAPGDLHRKLILADRGYMDIDYCRHVHHAGGSFIVRFKTGVNPVVVRARVGGRERVSWRGKTLAAIRDRLRGTSADLLVRWTHDDPPLRLLLIWNRSMRAHMALVTNLPSEDFDLASVRELYRLRWQIELLFKEWKSYANLHAFRTANPCIAEGLIWASLAAALLKRFVAHVTELVVRGVEISTRNAAMAFRYKAPELFRAILHAHVSNTASATWCAILPGMRNERIPIEIGARGDSPRGYVLSASVPQARVCLRTNVCVPTNISPVRPNNTGERRPGRRELA